MNDNPTDPGPSDSAPLPPPEKQWSALSAIQRRVAGVLVEKAKTTPDQYPLSLNALTNGCNQKSNRSPQMTLDPEDVEDTLEELREMGAVVEIQSGSRVAKYKHCLYQWLEVEKVELAVMAELLLRGQQTVGELRGRASRMEPIPDMSTLRPILNSLIDKGLVVSLSPEGRGQIVTHALFSEKELEQLKTQSQSASVSRPARAPVPCESSVSLDEFRQLQSEVAELRDEVQQLRSQLEQLLS